ncbi:hypothetical protein F53441_970 [Fusarium austroafricanum]|uniref:Uncharacterized protein n=1 Tax=Fusarium austroafricanum TaxID=2364996 RepID=A0A8H4KVU0_9HYPO|nr:hypothetical protein F53441_970 [Fusarium austroafricanum]
MADRSGAKTPWKREASDPFPPVRTKNPAASGANAEPLARKSGKLTVFKEYKSSASSEGLDKQPGMPRKFCPSFTYSATPLQSFSSDDFDQARAPQAGRDIKSSKTPRMGKHASPDSNRNVPNNSANAGTMGASTESDETNRRKFNAECKVKVLEICLSLKEDYLKMPFNPQQDQGPFWTSVLEKLGSNLVTQGKFNQGDWKALKDVVESWCTTRRTFLRERNLPGPGGQPELDEAIDAWNRVFVQRFCSVNRGYFEEAFWSLAKDKVIGLVKDQVSTWVTTNLQKRRDELESSVRPRLLSGSSSTDYNNAVKSLQDRIALDRQNQHQITETEAVLAMVTELQPELKRVLAQHLRNQNQSAVPPGPRAPTAAAGHLERARAHVSLMMPPKGPSIPTAPSIPKAPALQLPQKSPQKPKENGPSTKGKNIDSPDPIPLRGPVPLGPAVSGNSTMKNEGALPSATDQPKRPTHDTWCPSDRPPRTELPLKGRPEPSPRLPRRPQSPRRRSRSPPNGRVSSRGRLSPPPAPRYNDDQRQYRDRWPRAYDRQRQVQPRSFREDTVEFDNMSTREQNQTLRKQNRTILEGIEELKKARDEGHDRHRGR